jgi:hypothetical protein
MVCLYFQAVEHGYNCLKFLMCVCDGEKGEGGGVGMNITPGGHNQQGGDTELWGGGGDAFCYAVFWGGGG